MSSRSNKIILRWCCNRGHRVSWEDCQSVQQNHKSEAMLCHHGCYFFSISAKPTIEAEAAGSSKQLLEKYHRGSSIRKTIEAAGKQKTFIFRWTTARPCRKVTLKQHNRVTSYNSLQDMGFLIVVLLSFCYILFSLKTASATTFDVTSYGAIGNGITDDSQAFVQAWADLCEDDSSDTTLIIPPDMTFLLSPVKFNGSSCIFPTVNIKLLGNIIAPNTLDGWKDCEAKQFWIYFTSVQGLTINGPGKIDGQGSIWWRKQVTTETCHRPSALHFYECKGLRLNGTTHINSPFLHISINGCEDVDVGNLQIIAPADSPNTDGIDISSSIHINIHDSIIQTGDDCIAINGGIVDINVTGVLCGPGHGISIGSLGENGGYETVEQVRVQNCNITRTTNGLRIKTVPYGRGYAKGILFQDIYLVDVQNPIIIDQYYSMNSAIAHSEAPLSATAIHVSDVTYSNIYGSTATKHAITFNCSETFSCTKIVTNRVQITGGDEFAYCKNVEGEFVDTTPSVSCYSIL